MIKHNLSISKSSAESGVSESANFDKASQQQAERKKSHYSHKRIRASCNKNLVEHKQTIVSPRENTFLISLKSTDTPAFYLMREVVNKV